MPTQLSFDDLIQELMDQETANDGQRQRVEKENVEGNPLALDRFQVQEYWQAAFDVVDTWAQYQGTKKLEINLKYEETRHRVQHVEDKYYGGSRYRLQERVRKLSAEVNVALSTYDDCCAECGVDSVSREWLFDHLKESKHYASYRGKIQRRIKNPTKFPLKSLKDL